MFVKTTIIVEQNGCKLTGYLDKSFFLVINGNHCILVYRDVK